MPNLKYNPCVDCGKPVKSDFQYPRCFDCLAKMAPHTSVQTGLPGIPQKPAQAKMLEEFGTAPGQGGYRVPLTKAPARSDALPGQTALI